MDVDFQLMVIIVKTIPAEPVVIPPKRIMAVLPGFIGMLIIEIITIDTIDQLYNKII